MGLIDKFFKKKKVSSQEEPVSTNVETIMGFALLRTAEFEVESLAEKIKEVFHNKASIEITREKLVSIAISVETAQFLCTIMPFPVPDQEVESLFPYNSLSPDGEVELKAHQAFVVVAGRDFDSETKRKACMEFNRLCGAIMRMEQAVGMYMGGAGLLLEKKIYLKHVEIIESPIGDDPDYFPAPLWVRVLLYMDQDRKMARVSGLTQFGFPDVCIYDTHLEPGDLYQQLYVMAIEQITGRGIYKHGDLIRISDDKEAICKLENDVLHIIGT